MYNDEQMIKKYRLSREAIIDLIDDVHDDLAPATNRNHAIPPSLQVFLSLRVLATGSFQDVVSEGHGISKASVCRKLHLVTQAIVRHRRGEISFPNTVEDLRRVKEDFFEISHFPNVCGVIDGTLIPIKAPSEDEHLYVSRKGGHALNIQVVSDAHLMIRSAVVRYPATTHDSYIWSNCRLHDHFENGQFGDSWLLGDSGYG